MVSIMTLIYFGTIQSGNLHNFDWHDDPVPHSYTLQLYKVHTWETRQNNLMKLKVERTLRLVQDEWSMARRSHKQHQHIIIQARKKYDASTTTDGDVSCVCHDTGHNFKWSMHIQSGKKRQEQVTKLASGRLKGYEFHRCTKIVSDNRVGDSI